MIVRRDLSTPLLIHHSEHARHSGVLAAALDERWLGPEKDRSALLNAVAQHDRGWDPWDQDPQLAADGLPVNFMDLAKEHHGAIWQRSIFEALHQYGPIAADAIARHSLALMDAAPEHLAARQSLVDALATRAWGTDREPRLAAAFAVLFFADCLSLQALAGWKETHRLTLIDSDGSAVEFVARPVAPWTVAIGPWPFVIAALPHVSATANAVASSDAITVSTHYVPGGAA
jgi:hypothetical protein